MEKRYDKTEPINLGTGVEVSIKELVGLIMKIVNVNLEIKWKKDMPNGQPRRCVNTEKAFREIGFMPQITLEEGLRRTIKWYESNI